MAGLRHRAALARAEHAGQHGERGGQPVPEVAVVGVGAGVEQRPGGPQHGVERHVGVVAGVGEVEQRRPPVGAAVRPRLRGVGREPPADLVGVGDGGRREDVGPRHLGTGGQQPAGTGVALGVVLAVGEAGQPQELRRRVVQLADGVGLAGQLVEQLEVAHQPRPAGEAVVPGDDRLRGGEREAGAAGEPVLGGVGRGLGVSAPHGPLQVAGLVAELVEARTVGQGDGRHSDLLSHA